LQDLPTFTQIGIFGLKTNHLATLLKVGNFSLVPLKQLQIVSLGAASLKNG
jgi:hypothetical protein